MYLDITRLTKSEKKLAKSEKQPKYVNNDKKDKSKKKFSLSSNVDFHYLENLGLDNEILKLNKDLISQIAKAHYAILQKYYHPDTSKSPNAGRYSRIIKESYEYFLEALESGELEEDAKKKTSNIREKEIDVIVKAYSDVHDRYVRLNYLLCDIMTLRKENGLVSAKFTKDITYDIVKNGYFVQELITSYAYIYDTTDKENESIFNRRIKIADKKNNHWDLSPKGTKLYYDQLCDLYQCAKKGLRIYSPDNYRYKIDSDGNVSIQVPVISGRSFLGYQDLNTTRKDRIIGFIPTKCTSRYNGMKLVHLNEQELLNLMMYIKVQINPYMYRPSGGKDIAAVVRCEQDGKVFYRIDPLIERIESKGKKLLIQEYEIPDKEKEGIAKKIYASIPKNEGNKTKIGTSLLKREHSNDLLMLGIGTNTARMPLKIFEQLVVTRYQILFNNYKRRVDNFTQKIESLKKLMDSQESEKEYISSNSTKNEIERLEQLKIDCEKTQESLDEVYNLINPNFPNSRKYLHNLRAHLILNNNEISAEYFIGSQKLEEKNTRLSKKALSFITYTDDKNHVSNIKDRSIKILPLISLGRFVDMQTESVHEVKVNEEGGVDIQGEGRKKKKVKGKNIVGFIKKEDIEKKGGISSFIKELKINPEDNGVLLIEGDVDKRLKNNDVYGKNVPLRYASELIRNLEPTMQNGDYLVTFTPNDDFGGHFVIEGIVKE